MSSENRIGAKLRRLHLLIKQDFNHSLSALGLTSSQSQILNFILQKYPSSIFPKDIEKEFHLTHPTVLGILQRLKVKEYIRIEPDKSDRRCRNIIPTEKSYEIRREMIERIDTIEKTMENGMSAQEIETLLRLLNKAADNLTNLRTREE